jgi:hypothetical protein
MKRFIPAFLFVALLVLPADAQLFKTSLTLTVIDELGNSVEGATVMIFEKKDDYLAEKNPAAQGVTDAKGVIRLKELKPMQYYVLARKGDKDNIGGGEQVGPLEEKKFNKARVVIQ